MGDIALIVYMEIKEYFSEMRTGDLFVQVIVNYFIDI